MISHFNRITLSIYLSLLIWFKKAVALESNEKLSPQKISNTFDLCLNRSADCEVELDVPSTCINQAGESSCPIVFFLHGAGGTNDWFGRTSGVHGRISQYDNRFEYSLTCKCHYYSYYKCK